MTDSEEVPSISKLGAACCGKEIVRTAWMTPCANERHVARFGLQVDPWRLDECAECEFCGGCVTHVCYRDDASTLLHADWFMAFPAYGEPECGHMGGPVHLVPSQGLEACNLSPGHDGRHRTRKGWWWAQEAAGAVLTEGHADA
jgi:hypothetical protein